MVVMAVKVIFLLSVFGAVDAAPLEDARAASMVVDQSDDIPGLIRMPLTRVNVGHEAAIQTSLLVQAETDTESANSPLRNIQNTQYHASITVGTGDSPQTFTVIPDSGSANTWVYGQGCAANNGQSGCSTGACNNHIKFNAASSPTYHKETGSFKITYGSGSVTGDLFTDSVSLSNSHAATGFKMIAATCVISHEAAVFDESRFDGVMGLGYAQLGIQGTTPLLKTLKDQNKIAEPIFTFFLTKHNNEGSQLGIGAVDSNLHAEPIKWFKTMPESSHYSICLKKVVVNGETIKCPNECCPAVPDSGTTLLSGPTSMMQPVLNKVGTISRTCAGTKDLHDVEIWLEDTMFKLTPEDYVFKAEHNQNDCESGLMAMDFPADMGNMWVLGDVFLHKYFSVFDPANKKVGLALAASKGGGAGAN